MEFQRDEKNLRIGTKNFKSQWDERFS